MRYIWAKGTPAAKKRVHIQAFSQAGDELKTAQGFMVPMCKTVLPFNRSINAPFALGRKVCKHCQNAVH